MTDARPLFIVNPAASQGRSGRVFEGLRRPVERIVGNVDVVFTKAAGDARLLAKEAATQGRERIVAVGGDGTLSEVASGVLDSGRPSAVGLLHLGTGGDFRRSLDIAHRPDAYLQAIARGQTRLVDVGRFTHRDRRGEQATGFFLNVLSFGMGGLVDKYVGRPNRMVGGKAGYFAAAIEALFKGALGKLACELVDEEGVARTLELETRNLAVCNGRYFGSGMDIAPMAALDDGVFEVVAIGGEHKLPVLSLSAAIYDGKHLGRRGVTHLRARSIRLRLLNEAESPNFLLDVDGEWLGEGPLNIEVLPKALRVLA